MNNINTKKPATYYFLKICFFYFLGEICCIISFKHDDVVSEGQRDRQFIFLKNGIQEKNNF